MSSSEHEIGIECFFTSEPGIGGKLKQKAEDFIVEELSIPPAKVENGEYTIALVRARNWETNRLVRQLARSLRISRKRIGFAGTKDKRAISTQLLSFHIPNEKVTDLKISEVEILNLWSSNKGLELGNLLGNKFKIRVTSIESSARQTKKTVESIRKRILDFGGFPNFFGVQRFGGIRPITHIIGKYIIYGKFKEAVLAYVANPIEGEDEEAYEARRVLSQTEDYAEALKRYPDKLSFEKALLNHLVQNPNDYVGALKKLPKNLLMMFVHAYQAYLFNKILSRRLMNDLPINEPIIGDLILPIDKNRLPNHDVWIPVTMDNLSKIRTKVKEGKAFVSGLIFGSNSEFAKGMQGEIEQDIIRAEEITPKNFIIPKIPEISSKGNRRELLAPLKKLDYKSSRNSVVFEFQLPKGCYATCLLREFMKSNMQNY